MRVKHTTEAIVKPSVWPLDLSKAAQEGVDDLVAEWFDEYDATKPMTVTVSIEGEYR